MMVNLSSFYFFLGLIFEDGDGNPGDVFVASPLKTRFVVTGVDFFLVEYCQPVFNVNHHKTIEVYLLIAAAEHV